ncbi:hypothetical protein [Herbidospora mongoliensis]|uniref:hypothetical protein n=1 Tax=Herbidospora mongoliensis TaxID=688067 RepID=UPI00082F5433|nr:hypothetical protein [Herbidospora mongoliensis]
MTHDRHSALIGGLRDLADFLDANPAVPVPSTEITITVYPTRADDEEMRAVVDTMAAGLGAEINPNDLPYGHYSTCRNFGPVQYGAVAIMREAREKYAAQTSYEDNIQVPPSQVA